MGRGVYFNEGGERLMELVLDVVPRVGEMLVIGVQKWVVMDVVHEIEKGVIHGQSIVVSVRKVGRAAMVYIPEGIDGMDCQTNDMHPVVMVNALKMLEGVFAKRLVAMAEAEVGRDQRLQEQWLDFQTKKYLGDNTKSDDRFKFGDLN